MTIVVAAAAATRVIYHLCLNLVLKRKKRALPFLQTKLSYTYLVRAVIMCVPSEYNLKQIKHILITCERTFVTRNHAQCVWWCGV